jgi:hypothetical protein
LQQRQRLVDGLGAVLVNQLQRLLQFGGHPYRLADTSHRGHRPTDAALPPDRTDVSALARQR